MFSLGTLRILLASLAAGVLSAGLLFSTIVTTSYEASLRLEPVSGLATIGDTFTVTIVTDSKIPINVWQGVLTYDTNIIEIDRISYNTSVADLWAEEPWYSNGDGTLTFIGGTTNAGGFIGKGTLLTITFITVEPGNAKIAFKEKTILQHDGLGSTVPLEQPIDTIFTVISEESSSLASTQTEDIYVAVVPETISTDLNGDGRHNIIDTSIFMTYLATTNLKADFNQDEKVNTRDLSILLDAT